MNVLKTTELYTLKGWSLWSVNYISIKRKTKKVMASRTFHYLTLLTLPALAPASLSIDSFAQTLEVIFLFF